MLQKMLLITQDDAKFAKVMVGLGLVFTVAIVTGMMIVIKL
ncbi:hypothetical protein [Pseudoduganella ginsengisoli]|nr:hypothetical protein [Pseudoduganella ginsengisoli]